MAERVFVTRAEQMSYAAGWWAWTVGDPRMPYCGVPRTRKLHAAFIAGEADALLWEAQQFYERSTGIAWDDIIKDWEDGCEEDALDKARDLIISLEVQAAADRKFFGTGAQKMADLVRRLAKAHNIQAGSLKAIVAALDAEDAELERMANDPAEKAACERFQEFIRRRRDGVGPENYHSWQERAETSQAALERVVRERDEALAKVETLRGALESLMAYEHERTFAERILDSQVALDTTAPDAPSILDAVRAEAIEATVEHCNFVCSDWGMPGIDTAAGERFDVEGCLAAVLYNLTGSDAAYTRLAEVVVERDEAMEQARREEREAFTAELKAEAEHRIENARAVAELPGMEDEGRLRLLAAGFIDDILHARNLDQFGSMRPTTDEDTHD